MFFKIKGPQLKLLKSGQHYKCLGIFRPLRCLNKLGNKYNYCYIFLFSFKIHLFYFFQQRFLLATLLLIEKNQQFLLSLWPLETNYRENSFIYFIINLEISL